jgi:hypothetical protein
MKPLGLMDMSRNPRQSGFQSQTIACFWLTTTWHCVHPSAECLSSGAYFIYRLDSSSRHPEHRLVDGRVEAGKIFQGIPSQPTRKNDLTN